MRKKLLLIFLLCLPHLLGHAADIRVYDLRVENLTNPLGLDVSSPRFSWKISSDKKNTLRRRNRPRTKTRRPGRTQSRRGKKP